MQVEIDVTRGDLDAGYDYGHVNGPLEKAALRCLKAALNRPLFVEIAAHLTLKVVALVPGTDPIELRRVFVRLPEACDAFYYQYWRAYSTCRPWSFTVEVPDDLVLPTEPEGGV